MVREPAVAGQFYEADREKLSGEIETCFYSKLGPGSLPKKRSEIRIKAVIVPHAGYYFSGSCAAWAYKKIGESKFPDAFLLLGPNHFGRYSGLSVKDWKTPLGVVKTDKDLVEGIKEHTGLQVTEENHFSEHSIEVQLPLLQFTNKDRINDIRIIPIVLGNDIDFLELGKMLSDFVKNTGKYIITIVSSDFTHYGRNYHYVPFIENIPERLKKLDKGAINLILKGDVKGFREYLNITGITICGYIPILVFLSMMEHAKEKFMPELLMHYTSGDVVNDYRNSVSYVSMAFR